MSTPKERSGKRLIRAIKIIQKLQGRSFVTPASLAEELEVSERTIFRDLKDLEMAGFYVIYNSNSGRYEFNGAKFLRPMNFKLEEALILAVALQNLNSPVVGKEAHVLLEKLINVIPGKISDELNKYQEAIRSKSHPNSGENEDSIYLNTLQVSLYNGTPVDMENSSAHLQKKLNLLFEPYCIFFHLRGWYSVGRDVYTDEVKMVKLSRVSKMLKRISLSYSIPDGWTLEKHLGNAWGIVPGDKSYSVKIRFSPAGAEYVRDTLWHKTQKIKEYKDGSLLFTADVDGLEEIKWWVLGFGSTAKVEGPEELKNIMREEVNKMLESY